MVKSYGILWGVLLSFASAAQAKTTVIYFGGWGSTSSDMSTWQSGTNRSAYGTEYKFIGIPYPAGVGFKSDSALNSGEGQALVNKYVNMIVAAHKRDPSSAFVVAGHSSASPIAFAIASRLAQLPRPTPDFNVKFANLDGFNSPRSRFPSLCVQALDNVSTCAKIMRQPLGSCAHAIGQRNMCFHFSILNKNVNRATTIGSGYRNFSPNLAWLEKLDGAVPHADSAPTSYPLAQPAHPAREYQRNWADTAY